MNFNLTITLAQATTLIATNGHTNTVLLRGQPGIGKTAILQSLAKMMPDYLPCYVDCANLDLGDVAMPVVDREIMATSYAPNKRFGVHKGQTRPVLLMLDELGKAARPVMNMLLPTIHERRVGDAALPTGSIVFATTNLDTDGVGDNIPAHAYNRMTVVRVANPTADEWVQWGAANHVAPEVMAFAKQYPQVFECYADLDKETRNPYIFDPRHGNTKAFASPRSLEATSHLIKNRHVYGDALMAHLAGTVGEATARDMEAFVHLADRVPTFERIVKDPTKAALPDGAGAYFLLAFMLATRATAETIDAVATYIGRWESVEAQALYFTTAASSSDRCAKVLCKSRLWVEQAAKFGKFF